MTPAYAAKLSFVIQKTNVGNQKIDGSALTTYGIVISGFSLHDKLKRGQFFEKTFLLADTSIKVVLGMLFFTLSDTDIRFT